MRDTWAYEVWFSVGDGDRLLHPLLRQALDFQVLLVFRLYIFNNLAKRQGQGQGQRQGEGRG